MNLPRLHTEADRFVDEHGRHVILRGVNLGGDSKVPYPDGGTQFPGDFTQHRHVSFIGRPFPLDQADEHLERIRSWGFNCLRLLVTWEAVEHAGPGQYDVEFLEYFREVCRKAGEHGLYLFVDFHQDVWSRMSGGDGAPGWTFDAVGLDFNRFEAAGATHAMQHRFNYDDPSGVQAGYPPMSWAQNYRRPATAIMWTLFWGGARVTPEFLIDGVNVQEYLQGHFLAAMGQVARQVKHLPNVIGFDSLNEPSVGWLGQPLSPVVVDGVRDLNVTPLPGVVWSALEALAVARGIPTVLPVRALPGFDLAESAISEQTINPDGISIWHDGVACPFEQANIYELRAGRAVALNEDVFTVWDGSRVNVAEDIFGPFYQRVVGTIREHGPHWMLFAEMDPLGIFIGRPFPRQMPPQSVTASHWYDLMLLMSKHFDAMLSLDFGTGARAEGREGITARYVEGLAALKASSAAIQGGTPTLIGEFGIPYDMNDRGAYLAWARGERDETIWQAHTMALTMMYDAMDVLHLNSTQWNYTVGNRNDPHVGDQWNLEDLSIYSPDQGGGRAIQGFCRPFARALQGQLVSVCFKSDVGVFELAWLADPSVSQPTEVYLPRVQFPHGVNIIVQGAVSRQKHDPETQTLQVWASGPGTLRLVCTRPDSAAPSPQPQDTNHETAK